MRNIKPFNLSKSKLINKYKFSQYMSKFTQFECPIHMEKIMELEHI